MGRETSSAADGGAVGDRCAVTTTASGRFRPSGSHGGRGTIRTAPP